MHCELYSFYRLLGRLDYIRKTDGACFIGLTHFASLTLLTYDL